MSKWINTIASGIEFVSALRIAASPFLIALALAAILYFTEPSPTRLFFSVLLVILGRTVGILLAKSISKKQGETTYLARLSATPELDYPTQYTLNQLIGQKITAINHIYTYENAYGLQEFEAYFLTEDRQIFSLPYFPDEDISNAQTRAHFFGAKPYKGRTAEAILGKEIIDFYFMYIDNELSEMEACIMELEGGLFVSQQHCGPQGLTNIDLVLMDTDTFATLNKDLSLGWEMKSFVHELKIT